MSTPPFHTSMAFQRKNADAIPTAPILTNTTKAPIPSLGIKHVRREVDTSAGPSYDRSHFKATPLKNDSSAAYRSAPVVSTIK